MKQVDKEKVKFFREKGYSYSKIAALLSISENTIKTYCRRNDLGGVRGNIKQSNEEKIEICKQCSNKLELLNRGKRKKFCSDKCRRLWWKEHDDYINRKAYYKLICEKCNKEFNSYGNKNRKYCSHSCYIKNRFDKGGREYESKTV